MSKHQRYYAKKQQAFAKLAAEIEDLKRRLANSEQQLTDSRNDVHRLELERDVSKREIKEARQLTDDWRGLADRVTSNAAASSAVRAARVSEVDAREMAHLATVDAERARREAYETRINHDRVMKELTVRVRRESQLAGELEQTQRALATTTAEFIEYQTKNCEKRRRKASVSSTVLARQARHREARRVVAAEVDAVRAQSEASLAQQAIDNITDEMREMSYHANTRLSFTPPALALITMFTFVIGGMARPTAMREAANTHHISLTTMYVYYNYYTDTGEVFSPYACVIGRQSCPLLEHEYVVEHFHDQMRQWRAVKRFRDS